MKLLNHPIDRIVIVDGYTDEPAGLGVPPYLDVYPRYAAGAIWSHNKHAEIKYFTIDQVRVLREKFYKLASNSHLLIVISGVTVPGRYLGGKPITRDELLRISRIIEGPIKLLAGPTAKFGIGLEGGKVARLPSELKGSYDLIVSGDVEEVLDELMDKKSVEGVWGGRVREDYSKTDKYSVLGAKIIVQHPCHGRNLVLEIETYRGCPRWFIGGCSFCIEPLYGEPKFRNTTNIVREVEALYRAGGNRFRLGRQPDLYSYMSRGVGELEFPIPNVEALKRLFRGIRSVALKLETLHIDNVNPGTIYHHPRESREITKIIIENHTPGDVAAFGVESADPEVVRRNGLKVMPEEALEAIRIVCELGSARGWNGLPHLLPGINFVHGLIGETVETYKKNLEFLREILGRGYLVRRTNIRQVMAFPKTKMWSIGDSIIKRHKRIFRQYREKVKREFDIPMLKRVLPRGTILRRVYVEKFQKGITYSRQPGSYPITIETPEKLPVGAYMDFTVSKHKARSVIGIPYPLNVNKAPKKLIKLLPGLSNKNVKLTTFKGEIKSDEELVKILGVEASKYACTSGGWPQA